MDSMIGDKVEFGREPDLPGFILKERSTTDSVVWAPRAQNIKNSGYTLERVIIGRKQANIQIQSRESYLLTPIHQRIPTFAFIDGELQMITKPQALVQGARIVIGTYVLSLSGA
jgi:hypothetical protein